ncbi:MAG: hypothetical protein IJ412_05110 [Oscillospiraceae bacterium]|nr:hypothetical protein [Oscillospiraceae bacterium]
MVTYTLAFLGTVRYRYPLISLQTQAVIAPFEWIVLLNLFFKSARFNYAVAAYVLWALLDFAIIVLSFVTKKVPLKRKMMFLMLIILVTVALYDTVINHDAMFFFSYFNTIVGVLIWLGYVFNPIQCGLFLWRYLLRNWLQIYSVQ